MQKIMYVKNVFFNVYTFIYVLDAGLPQAYMMRFE